MKEDTIVGELINRHDSEEEYHQVEKHYNHFGDRGVVDLVRNNTERKSVDIIEVKAESAIEDATGANEIVRQFKRHRKHFFDGVDASQYAFSRGNDYYHLVFAATETCLDHIFQNRAIYETVANKPDTLVYVIHPDVGTRGYPLRDGEIGEWVAQDVFAQELDWMGRPDSQDSTDTLDHEP